MHVGDDLEDLSQIVTMEDLIGVMLDRLNKMGNEEQVNEWRSELFNSDVDYNNREAVLDWYENIRRNHGPRLIGYESCINHLPLVLANSEVSLPRSGVLDRCGWCKRYNLF